MQTDHEDSNNHCLSVFFLKSGPAQIDLWFLFSNFWIANYRLQQFLRQWFSLFVGVLTAQKCNMQLFFSRNFYAVDLSM